MDTRFTQYMPKLQFFRSILHPYTIHTINMENQAK